ncbi:uncharacterized protein JCM10292_001032 [Rhodotorula paludigena]|uniref:uncharacterized protein n=1 Tax=Rhodotorula paludigena TaxID=86838 RepID=UPI0031788D38
MSKAQFKSSDRVWTTSRAKTEGQLQTAIYTEDEQTLFKHVVGVLESLSSTVALLVFALLDYHCKKRSFTQFDKTIAAPYLEGFAASGGRGRIKDYTAPISTNDKHKAAVEVAIEAIEELEGVARDVAKSYWWDGSAELYYPYLAAYKALLKANLVTVGIDKFFRSLDKFWEDVPTKAAATHIHGPRCTIEEVADYVQIVLNIVAKKNAAYTKVLANVGGNVKACELRKLTEKRIRIGLIVHLRLENYHNGVNADGNKDNVFPHRSSTALIAQRSLNTGMFAMAAAGAAKEQLQTSGKEEEIDYKVIYRKVCSKHNAKEAKKAEKAKSKKGKGKKKDKQGGESK